MYKFRIGIRGRAINGMWEFRPNGKYYVTWSDGLPERKVSRKHFDLCRRYAIMWTEHVNALHENEIDQRRRGQSWTLR